jgi:hypothetical protein
LLALVVAAGLVLGWLYHVRSVEGFDTPPPDPNTFLIEDGTTQFPEEIKSHVVFRGSADKELTLPSANSVTDQSLVILNATTDFLLTLVPSSGSVFQNGGKKLVLAPQETLTLHCNGVHWAVVSEWREREAPSRETDGPAFKARGKK